MTLRRESSGATSSTCRWWGTIAVTRSTTTAKESVRPSSEVSKINENSTCLDTQKQNQETRGGGEIDISGALSASLLRIVMRIAVLSMV